MQTSLKTRLKGGIASVRAEEPSLSALMGRFNDLNVAFTAFREANDNRISALEKGKPDVVTNEKVDRINSDITRLQNGVTEMATALAAAQLGGGAAAHGPKDPKHTQAFSTYFRKGDPAALVEVQAALSRDSNPDGGYLAPVEVDKVIDRILSRYSALRPLATVRTISAQVFRKPVTTSGAAGGWVGEQENRPETTAPKLSVIEFPAMEVYAQPAATQSLIDDAEIDIEAWLGDEVGITFAEQEGDAFVNGNGVNRPFGFLTPKDGIVADANWAWNKLGYIPSGAAGAFAASTPSDALIDLAYALRQGYRSNATWIMNRKTQAAVRKLKDGQNNYIWQPGATAGQPAMLMGYPVADDDNMPDIAANSYSIGFGDFKRGYLIVDRVGTRVLRDAYTAKPYVLFYTTKRVGGGIQNFEAIKLMKFAVS